MSFLAFASRGPVGAKDRCKWCGAKLRKKWTEHNAPRVLRWVPLEVPLPGGGWAVSNIMGNPVDDHPERVKVGTPTLGDYRDGHFCGLRCGYDFGLWYADRGHVLKVKS